MNNASEVVIATVRTKWKRKPPLCHPERSRGICSFPPPSIECLGNPRLFIPSSQACGKLRQKDTCNRPGGKSRRAGRQKRR
jgi:hypothetical protein